ncbi:MAG: SRPBCC family protein [Candidatus Poribacteria bacterium]|nr:SRPBCC family protein [Candidatus Poribacteria bacterium]
MARVAVTVEFNRTADEIWGIVGGFLTIDQWVPAVLKLTTKLEGIDIIRHLDLGGGGFVVEPLLTYDNAERVYSYAITDGTMPVENYVAQLRVLEADNGKSCVAQWTASFNPTAPEQEVVDLVANGVFRGALEGLKAKLGA